MWDFLTQKLWNLCQSYDVKGVFNIKWKMNHHAHDKCFRICYHNARKLAPTFWNLCCAMWHWFFLIQIRVPIRTAFSLTPVTRSVTRLSLTCSHLSPAYQHAHLCVPPAITSFCSVDRVAIRRPRFLCRCTLHIELVTDKNEIHAVINSNIQASFKNIPF